MASLVDRSAGRLDSNDSTAVSEMDTCLFETTPNDMPVLLALSFIAILGVMSRVGCIVRDPAVAAV